MAFNAFTPSLAKSWQGTGISATLRKGQKSDAKLTLYITERVLNQLDMNPGKVAVMLGSGSDHGIIRLAEGEGDGELVERQTNKGKFYQLQLGHIPQFTNSAKPKAHCKWEWLDEEKCLEIVLPSWAEETRPKQPSAQQQAIAKAKAAVPSTTLK